MADTPEEIKKQSVAEIVNRDTYINNKPVIDAPIFLNQATFISSAFVILTKLNGNKRKYTPYINEKIDNTNKLNLIILIKNKYLFISGDSVF